jgi:glycine cleavage system aminomethyltransferase T
VTSAVYSPDFDLNLGLAMLSIEQAENGQRIDVEIEGQIRKATVL